MRRAPGKGCGGDPRGTGMEDVEAEGEDVYKTASQALQDIADGRVRGFTDIALAKRWLFKGDLPDQSV